MEICLIAAMATNNVIGLNNTMPWHLPEDLKHFKKVTMGCPIVMGRKTFESIGRALPGRENLVLTRDPHFQSAGISVFTDITKLKQHLEASNTERVFVIGGSQIYKIFLEDADRLYLTKIHAEIEGDTFFPEVDASKYEIVESEKGRSEKSPHLEYEFQTLARKN